MDIDTNGRGIAQIDDDESDPTCERCAREYTMEAGDVPTPFCDRCAHDVLEEQSAELDSLRTTLARLTAEVEAMRAERDERDRLLRETTAALMGLDDYTARPFGGTLEFMRLLPAEVHGQHKAWTLAESKLASVTAERAAIGRSLDASASTVAMLSEQVGMVEKERDEAAKAYGAAVARISLNEGSERSLLAAVTKVRAELATVTAERDEARGLLREAVEAAVRPSAATARPPPSR